MVVDGKEIAKDLLEKVAQEVLLVSRTPRMAVITCNPNFETRKYLEMKAKKAESVGVELAVKKFPSSATTEMIVEYISTITKFTDGIVVQLPLPKQIDRDIVLAAVPVNKDPDGFSYGVVADACFSPVVGAIDEISTKYKVEWQGKKVVVLGKGRLVGLPAIKYAEAKGGDVSVLAEKTYDEVVLKEADIIVSGIGQPHFIKPELVKEGVIIFDAGTSEDGGVLVGDVDVKTFSKTSLVTPVPGGIGPITIAYLLSNLVKLARQ